MKLVDRMHRLDPASILRLEWATHALRNAFAMQPSDTRPSWIVRRALQAYCCHLDSLLCASDAHAELRRLCEAQAVRTAMRGTELGLSTQVVLALPVRPLAEIVRARTSAPRTIELLNQDLRRWKATPTDERDDDVTQQTED